METPGPMRHCLADSWLPMVSRTRTAWTRISGRRSGWQNVCSQGLHGQLVASEPLVRQPVAIEFDDRGRLWVIQYLQYPNPAGLARKQVDRYSRTQYDQIPEPPPKGPSGADRITILSDADGDGVMDHGRDFVSGSTSQVAWHLDMVASLSCKCLICCFMPIAIATIFPMATRKFC